MNSVSPTTFFGAITHMSKLAKKKKKKSLGKRFFSPKMFHMLIKDSVRGLAFNDEMLIKPLWFLPQSVTGFDKNLISILIRNYFSSEL